MTAHDPCLQCLGCGVQRTSTQRLRSRFDVSEQLHATGMPLGQLRPKLVELISDRGNYPARHDSEMDTRMGQIGPQAAWAMRECLCA